MDEQYKTKLIIRTNREFSHILHEIGEMNINSDKKVELYRRTLQLKQYIKDEIKKL